MAGPEKTAASTKKAVLCLAFIVAVIFLLLRNLLVGDEALLSFDSRLWPPFSASATSEIFDHDANMIYSDLPGWMMPERLVIHNMMNQEIPPLWTPYTLGGMPLLASLVYPIYYPINVVLNSIPGLNPYQALGVQTFLNLVLAGVGMFLFLGAFSLGYVSRLTGALCLCLSAWFITHMYIPIFLNSAVWIPLIFWAGEMMMQKRAFGRYALFLAIFTGCSLLGGFPQTTLTGLYGVGFWIVAGTLFRKDLGRIRKDPGWREWAGRMKPVVAFMLAAGIGISLSMIQMLPAMELKDHSMRDKDYPLEYYKQNSLEPPSLLGQLTPGIFGHPGDPEGNGGRTGVYRDFPTYQLFLNYDVQNNVMENSLFIGVIPLFLALGALGLLRRRLPVLLLYLLALVILLIAMGTPLLDLCYHCLPGFSVGSPKRMLVLHTFALAALAGFGLNAFHCRSTHSSGRAYSLFLLSAGLAGVAALTVGFTPLSRLVAEWWTTRAQGMGIDDLTPERMEQALDYLKKVLWPAAAAILFLGVARIFHRFRVAAGIVPVALCLASFAELAYFDANFMITQPASGQYPATGTTDFLSLKNETAPLGPARAAAFNYHGLLLPDLAAVHGVHSLGGVSGLIHRRYGELCNAMDPGMIDLEDPRYIGTLLHEKSLTSPILDLMGVRYIAIGKEEDLPVLKRNGFVEAYRNDMETIALFENPEALPRAFAVTSCSWASEGLPDDEAVAKEALERVCSPDFDAGETVVLELPAQATLAPRPDREGRKPEIQIEKYSPLEVAITAQMHDARGFLVLTDTYYPGWEAFVDDEPAPIERANYAFRAVFLDEGCHTVRFRYDPGSFRKGRIVSIAALILIAIWALGILALSARARNQT